MSFSKFPPETLLNIAGNLSTEDHLALCLTSKKLRGVSELLLYVDIRVTVEPGTARLDTLLNNLSSDEGRANRARRLTVVFAHVPTPQELKTINDIAVKLPRLRIFNIEYDCDNPDTNAGVADPVSSLPSVIPSFLKTTTLPLTASAPPSSLINVTWRSPIVQQGTFTNFVQHHANIRCLMLRAALIPDLDAGILPNLEVLQAPLEVVLRLLPGRPIRRVSTVARKKVNYQWKKTKDALLSVEVFSCVQAWGDTEGHMWLPEMVGWMKNLQVLHLSYGIHVIPVVLRHTKIRFLRAFCVSDAKVEELFDSVPSLECVERVIRGSLMRSYRNNRVEKRFMWNSKPSEEWLANWEESA
ncbi:hypothetical protein PTI98_005687 [Pleurotus ostreatus]|nr:hypothetical protein PTI98_005687 [Pleurotus ostreatus]